MSLHEISPPQNKNYLIQASSLLLKVKISLDKLFQFEFQSAIIQTVTLTAHFPVFAIWTSLGKSQQSSQLPHSLAPIPSLPREHEVLRAMSQGDTVEKSNFNF